MWINCELMPVFRPDDLGSPREKKPGGDSVRARVIVMMEGAYTRDTLNALLPSLPQLSIRAVHNLDPCGGYVAYSVQQSPELYLVWGNPVVTGSMRRVLKLRGDLDLSAESASVHIGNQLRREDLDDNLSSQ